MFLSDLVPDITLQIPGCTDDVAMAALVEGARRFYRESTLWRDAKSYSLVAGGDVLRLRAPETTDIAAVRYVTFEGRELEAKQPVEFTALQREPAYAPDFYTAQLRDCVVRISPPASRDQNNSYNVECVLIPNRDADELEVDNFAAEFEGAYTYGALAKLFSMPLFLNLQLAAYNEALFADMVQRAMNKAQGLLNGGVLSTTYGGL